MNDALKKLRIPAIGLIVTGSLNGLIGLFILFSGIFRLLSAYGYVPEGPVKEMPIRESAKFGYYLSTFGLYGAALLSLVLAPLIIYGASKMMKGQKYRLARTAAILSVIPLTSCCFPLE